MILEYIHSDNSKEEVKLDLDVEVSEDWINISTTNKLEFIKKFLPSFSSGQKIVLFDSNHKQLLEFHKENDINNFDLIKEVNNHSQLLFFTSGSSGFPVGAFKSRDNLIQEVLVLKELVKKYNIKKVVVTVPFVHIYGVLAGLLLPLYLKDVKLVVKDDFLPYELLEEVSEKNTLVITTPVFIKSLGKLSDTKDLDSSLFICSTGVIYNEDILLLENKYNTNIVQIFGSTETGGIAYKFSTDMQWTSLDGVQISTDEDKLAVKSEFISKYILNKKIVKFNQPFITEDIVEVNKNKFSLIGRSNKIIKIAGKRISALQIESIIENIDGVDKAIVELVYKKELLRSEQIKITLQSEIKIDKKTIKKKINDYYGVLTIPFSLIYVDKINYSAVGKKIIF